MSAELKFEKIINKLSESWGRYLHGDGWDKKKLAGKDELSEEEHKKAMEVMAQSYFDIVQLCDDLVQERDSAFRSFRS